MPGGDRGPKSGVRRPPDRLDRRVPRVRDGPDARGGDAALDARGRVSRQHLLGHRRVQHDARPVAGLFAPRSDPAGVLVPRRCRAAVFDREPPGGGADVRPHAGARDLAQRGAHSARHLPPLARAAADLLDVRGHADADRSRLHLPVPAGVRPASRAGRRLRRPSRGLLGRIRDLSGAGARPVRALQQEHEHLVGLRRLVPESLPAGTAVRGQRRRLVDAQLHPDAGDDDARPVGGRVAQVGADRRSEVQRPPRGGRRAGRRGSRVRRARHLSDRQARVDLVLHALQRRSRRHPARGVLRAPGRQELAALGFSAARRRRELDRRLRHELDDGGFRAGRAGASPGTGTVCDPRAAVRGGTARRGRAAGVLARSAVDVSAARLRAHLIGIARSTRGNAVAYRMRRMNTAWRMSLIGTLVACALAAAPAPQQPAASTSRASQTPLDKYVAAPDATFAWTVSKALPADGATATLIELTSQKWLTEQEVENPIWKHWLIVVTPPTVTSDVALLFIGGGRNDRQPPAAPSPWLVEAARETGTITAELRMVPNQPVVFKDDPARKPRTEDDFIAYTWDHFLRTGDDRWLARLPMTKS